MKTKFIKVSVEERLPELKDDSVVIEFENGELSSVHREDWFKDITAGRDEKGNQLYSKWYLSECHPKVLYWLEEVEDREDEMREMLEKISEQLREYPHEPLSELTEDKINKLLNELK
jgi:hypothetical protein